MTTTANRAASANHTDVAVIGGGFSGIAMAVRLKRAGRHDFTIFERGHDVGGTWRDNSYPGCACDVPSQVYSLSFALNPEWSSTFSSQSEIQAYLQRVAEQYGVLPHIRFGCELEEAAWDEGEQIWRLQTSAGPATARILVAAAGPFSEASVPDIPGLRDFEGTVFHSASWDHDHDLEGERVAVIGTGASAIQFVPKIQPDVERLHLFQRTAPWVLPRPERRIGRIERAIYRRLPALQRLMRRAVYWGRELYALPMLRAKLSPIVKAIGLRQLRRTVPDPALLAKLTPDYAPGCKRILLSNDYLPSLSEPNVDLVTDGIVEVRERSVVTADGAEREVDTIILGTGFNVTNPPIGRRIRGRDGRTMAEQWAGSAQAHRGTTVAGFPNLFLLLGPNTGTGHNSVVFMAEAQSEYVIAALEHLRSGGLETVEVRSEAQAAWNVGVQRKMKGTVWTAGGCASWYLDDEGRNTTLWPGFTFRFRRALQRFDAAEYSFAPARIPAPAEHREAGLPEVAA